MIIMITFFIKNAAFFQIGSSYLYLLIQRMIQDNSQNLPNHGHHCHAGKNKGQNKSHPSKPEKPPESIIPESQTQGQAYSEYLCCRKAFLVFSHIHENFALKHDTMFLAFEIYLRITLDPQFKSTHGWELQCVSIFLAMKYQQIYPPSLKLLAEAMEWEMPKEKYIKIEQKALYVLKGSLNFSLMSRELQTQLGQVQSKIEMLGLFLLEIAVVSQNIFPRYPREKIIQAIVIIVKWKDQQYLSSELVVLLKLMIEARGEVDKKHQKIYNKYRQKRYEYVSDLHLPVRRKTEHFHD